MKSNLISKLNVNSIW